MDEQEQVPSPAEQLVEDFDAFPDPKEEAAKAAAKGPAKDPKTGRFLPKQTEAPVATTAPDELPITTPKHTHSKLLTRQALELGASESDLAETPSEDLRLWIQDQSNRRLVERQTERTPVESPTPEVDLGLGELANDIDPRLVGLLKNLAEKVQGMERHLTGKQIEEQTNRAERAFAADSDVFGEGTLDDLDPNGIHMMRRNMAAAEIRRLSKEPGSFESKMKKIASALRGDKPKAKETNGHTPRFTKEQWNKGGVQTPTDREGAPEPKGLRAAKKTFLSGMAEFERVSQSSGDEDEAF